MESNNLPSKKVAGFETRPMPSRGGWIVPSAFLDDADGRND